MRIDFERTPLTIGLFTKSSHTTSTETKNEVGDKVLKLGGNNIFTITPDLPDEYTLTLYSPSVNSPGNQIDLAVRERHNFSLSRSPNCEAPRTTAILPKEDFLRSNQDFKVILKGVGDLDIVEGLKFSYVGPDILFVAIIRDPETRGVLEVRWRSQTRPA